LNPDSDDGEDDDDDALTDGMLGLDGGEDDEGLDGGAAAAEAMLRRFDAMLGDAPPAAALPAVAGQFDDLPDDDDAGESRFA
jgi:hypothetical protein